MNSRQIKDSYVKNCSLCIRRNKDENLKMLGLVIKFFDIYQQPKKKGAGSVVGCHIITSDSETGCQRLIGDHLADNAAFKAMIQNA